MASRTRVAVTVAACLALASVAIATWGLGGVSAHLSSEGGAEVCVPALPSAVTRCSSRATTSRATALSQATPVIEVGDSAAVRVIVRLVDRTIPGEAASFDVESSDEDGRGTDVIRTTVTMQVVPQGEVCW